VPRVGDSSTRGPDPTSAVAGAAQDPALPELRFRPPAQRRGMVRRTRLLERLDAVPADVPLIVLAAPAGYGKTTALTQWAAGGDRPIAWVTLDSTDNDPVQLARHIALALQQAVPLPEPETAALTRGNPGGPAAVLQRLLNLVHALPGPTALVLDDLHEVQAREALALVQGIVQEAPPGLHVAIAARTRPALRLGRLRADRRCAEFGRSELGFSEDETRLVLDAAGQHAAPATVQAVERRTEGWPAGVYLAALLGRIDGTDAGADAATVGGDDVYIADYFRDELLARESPDAVRFLLRTSVLQQMSAPLCDAVLEQGDSGMRLAEAERRNLFVVPLDRNGQWYRYHRLFQEMLLSELRRREPGEEFRLHRRASAWYERAGQPELAIAHALAGQDQLTAARIINSRAREFTTFGRVKTVEGWFRSLHHDTLVAYPPIAVTAAWLWAFGGDPVEAQRSLQAARQASFRDSMPDGSTSLDSAVTLLTALLAPHGVEQMLDDAGTVVQLEPPGSPWRPLALAALGVAHVLNGAPELAVKEFTLAVDFGRGGQPGAVALSHAELALLALHGGEASADAESSASLAVIDEAGLREDLNAVLPNAVGAWAAARRGDAEAAREHAAAAQRVGAHRPPTAFPWLAAQVALTLGRAALELHDPVAARLRLDEARRHLNHLLTEGTLRSQFEDLARRVAEDGGRPHLSTAMSLTAAEVRVLQLLPTHLTLQEIADELFVTRSTVKSQVSAIYRKVQATTRSQAVQRGRELGLLET
jgi:LuxR family maltose regulon positive regulatory protein